jgi:dolichol kinase
MAGKKAKKKKVRIKFGLTVGGLLAVAVVCFCIFLWMFLLGIWAGQTILLPAS